MGISPIRMRVKVKDYCRKKLDIKLMKNSGSRVLIYGSYVHFVLTKLVMLDYCLHKLVDILTLFLSSHIASLVFLYLYRLLPGFGIFIADLQLAVSVFILFCQ